MLRGTSRVPFQVETVSITYFIHKRGHELGEQPHLVSNEADLHSVAAGGVPNALHPVGGVVQGLRVGDVVHQHDAVRPSVVRLRDLMEFLLRKTSSGARDVNTGQTSDTIYNKT